MLSFTRRLVASRSGPLGLRALSTPPSQSTDAEQVIISKLTERFSPSELAVQDVSGGCGSFFAIKIASEAFKGLSTIKQHRLVTEVLKKEIEGIHGLQVRTRSMQSAQSHNLLLPRSRQYPRRHSPLVSGVTPIIRGSFRIHLRERMEQLPSFNIRTQTLTLHRCHEPLHSVRRRAITSSRHFLFGSINTRPNASFEMT
ncbi:hypothetical protein HYDPIDRAFT_77657 [Hydnomerulius pinastri MD-312]|nr:hypothetical protein HYDPIDRAFT_77657 [Hydnomerulius pinastri MD-312]